MTKLESNELDYKINANLISYLTENPDIIPRGKVVAIHKRNFKSYCGSINTEVNLCKYLKEQMVD